MEEKSYFAKNIGELLKSLEEALENAKKLKKNIDDINNWEPEMETLDKE